MNDIPLIEVRNLRKEFKGGVKAVNNVSFKIREGICFGLLGPNGAGKTTTIEMLEGITPASGGEVLYRGRPRTPDFKEKLGIQFQSTALPDFLTVREVLRLFSTFYEENSDISELIRLCNLSEFLDRDTHKLSGGQRQRVLLALALVNNPDVVFLDEPTTGLDPQARRNFWALVQAIKAKKKTLILTTHYMEEAYILCDEIIIMDQGKILIEGPPDRLLGEHFEGISAELPRHDLSDSASTRLKAAGFTILEREDRIEIQTSSVASLIEVLQLAGTPLGGLRIRSQTLEDLFLKLTGKELRG